MVKKTYQEKILMNLGPTELIIILLIVVLIFGVGRIGKIGGELGSGIKAFKDGITGGESEKDEKKEEKKEDEKKDEDKKA
jgi:sec-independent protein translocase protein TatA